MLMADAMALALARDIAARSSTDVSLAKKIRARMP
jgi:hypothetical protein